MNYGRASQALLIYKTATRRFIARTLKSQNGGAGDWFADLVLAKLSGPMCSNIKRVMDESEEGTVKNRGGLEDEGPERFLEETHFPNIVGENWDAFRHSLKDRDTVLRQLRQIKKYRNEKVAHNSEPVLDEEVTEIIEACRSVVARFDSSAAEQLTELLSLPQVNDDAKVESSQSQEAEPAGSVSEQGSSEGRDNVWREVDRFERERTRKLRRLHRLMRQFADLSAAYMHIDDLTHQVDKLRPIVELDINQGQLEEAQSDLYILLWDETAPDLLAELISTADLGDWADEQPFYGELMIQREHDGVEVEVKLSLWMNRS